MFGSVSLLDWIVMSIKRELILVSMLLALSAPGVPAQPKVLFVRCEPPKGPDVSYGWATTLAGETRQSPDDGFEIGEDSFTDMFPSFTLHLNEPDILWAMWSSTVPEGMSKEEVEALSPTRLHKNVVVRKSDNILSSIGLYEDEIWLQTFYFNLGVAIFTRHKHRDDWFAENAGMAQGSLMTSKCEFEIK